MRPVQQPGQRGSSSQGSPSFSVDVISEELPHLNLQPPNSSQPSKMQETIRKAGLSPSQTPAVEAKMSSTPSAAESLADSIARIRSSWLQSGGIKSEPAQAVKSEKIAPVKSEERSKQGGVVKSEKTAPLKQEPLTAPPSSVPSCPAIPPPPEVPEEWISARPRKKVSSKTEPTRPVGRPPARDMDELAVKDEACRIYLAGKEATKSTHVKFHGQATAERQSGKSRCFLLDKPGPGGLLGCFIIL